MAELSRSINANDEALGQLLARAKSVTKVLADRAGQVNQLVIDGNQLFAALDERRAALSNLISGIETCHNSFRDLWPTTAASSARPWRS